MYSDLTKVNSEIVLEMHLMGVHLSKLKISVVMLFVAVHMIHIYFVGQYDSYAPSDTVPTDLHPQHHS